MAKQEPIKTLIAEIKYHQDQAFFDPTCRLVRVTPLNPWHAAYWHRTEFEKTSRISIRESAQAILAEMDAACNEGRAVLVSINEREATSLRAKR